MTETLYKVLNTDGSCYYGGQGSWHLPKGNRPGKWMPKIEGKLSPCSNGYHVLKASQLIEWIAPAVGVFIVETHGQAIWQADKGVVREARLIRRLDTWTEQTARLFACDCAEHFRDSLNASELANFDACLLMTRRYVFGMVSEADLDRAWARAWAGAGARAWAWARARARVGAWAGAGARARARQTDRLFQYLNGQVDLEEIKRRVTP